MSNPRKFSEKIQIQMQKQEEETRLFNETMQDAQLVKHMAGGQGGHVGLIGHPPQQQQQHHLLLQQQQQQQQQQQHMNHNAAANQMPHVSRSQHLIPSYPPYPRGGSLPNVNQMANQTVGIDLRNALDHLEILTTDPSPRSGGGGGQRRPSPTPQTHTHSGQLRHHSPKRPMEYAGVPSYLSPPESSQLTKRAHSDSALHQSANPQGLHLYHHNDIVQQIHTANFTPTRRSPVPPEKMTPDPNFAMWIDPSKMMQNQNRPKSCEIPAMSGYVDHSRQPHGQHLLLSPPSIQSSSSAPATNSSTGGSLPDLTNPSMNFPTLVSPLDPEDNAQTFLHNGSQVYMNNNQSQIRATGGSHSPSTSPQARRSSPMRNAADSQKSSGSAAQKQKQQQHHQQHQHPPQGVLYSMPEQRGPPNHVNYSPYQQQQIQNSQPQNFSTYRSNSSSPSMHEQLSLHQTNSNPSSPGSNSGITNISPAPYSQDQNYLDMHQTVQQKFEQIDIDQSGNQQQLDMNAMYDFLRNQANDMGQIPDIIFTGADDPALGLRNDYSSFFSAAGTSSSGGHPFQQHHTMNGGGDPGGYSLQESQDQHVDLMAELSKLDQYDLGMLSDETLRNIDPETEEQFRLDSNVP
ncbi:hypothetical protein BV898_08076 [Hypsibius exemplaris]|uniref:Transducer of regulated CREB activity N-terminal domain-containing protein n=1 Tax=Hypsibius exemplaris TaxID=2072580 RepID=A0A1W0WRE8_HYPEX|nr:hypothetical protein BV898_08076 [Hypsibius exemplaris]